MCALVEMPTSVPAVNISRVVNNEFPSFHTVGSISLRGFCMPPEVSYDGVYPGFQCRTWLIELFWIASSEQTLLNAKH